MFSPAEADITLSYVELFFSGIYAPLFVICIYILLRNGMRNVNIILFSTAIVLYSLSLVAAALNQSRITMSFTEDPRDERKLIYTYGVNRAYEYTAAVSNIAQVRA